MSRSVRARLERLTAELLRLRPAEQPRIFCVWKMPDGSLVNNDGTPFVEPPENDNAIVAIYGDNGVDVALHAHSSPSSARIVNSGPPPGVVAARDDELDGLAIHVKGAGPLGVVGAAGASTGRAAPSPQWCWVCGAPIKLGWCGSIGGAHEGDAQVLDLRRDRDVG